MTACPPAPDTGRPLPLLEADDPPPFVRLNPDGRAPALIVADHAGRAVPRRLNRLGLGDAAFDKHVAYDIGAAWAAERLVERLDAPALVHGYSRLVIDPNRRLDDPTSICMVSDGIVVPGNRDLPGDAAQARAEALFHPYHRAIDAEIVARLEHGQAPAIISVHSFTPEMNGTARPWQVGILWAEDGRMAEPVMAHLAGQGWCVGDNEPYSGRDLHGYTMETHALPRGLPNILIEFRQDLVATPQTARAWADRLAEPIAALLADPALTRLPRPPA